MSRELFIYWHVAPAQADEAVAAVTAWQRGLSAAQPGLALRLYRRTDERADRITVMETYAMPGGISDAVQAVLVGEGNAASARWRQGERHIEVFEPLA